VKTQQWRDYLSLSKGAGEESAVYRTAWITLMVFSQAFVVVTSFA